VSEERLNSKVHPPAEPLARAACLLLGLFTFAIGLMQPPVPLLGFDAIAADLLYPFVVLVWLLAVAVGQASVIWHRGYWLLLLYFLALVISTLVSDQADVSLTKLMTQCYLLSLPIVVCSLVDDARRLRLIILWWLAGAAIIAVITLVAAIVLTIDPDNPWLSFARFYFGTLPPGPYPRIRATFLNGNMLCNFLSVSLVLSLVARRMGWIRRSPATLLPVGLVAAAIFTISPGLGGIALVLGIWGWLVMRETRAGLARNALVAGLLAAVAFVAASAITPIIHPTAPFLIRLPFGDIPLAPSGRLMAWMDAVDNVAGHLWFGRGIGQDAVWIRYRDPSGNLQTLTDAHNSFLSIAVQCGLFGLCSLTALVLYAASLSRPFRLLPGDSNLVRLGLGIAFIGGFAYQGLTGSFEDARHLWLLLGLLFAAARIERSVALQENGRFRSGSFSSPSAPGPEAAK
jgi:hypothetical protein